MKNSVLLLACCVLLAACGAPPKVSQPSGDWTPVNKQLTVKG